jgi:hypothetical protein
MHDTSTAGTPTPTDPDSDEQVRNILSHIFGEAHADGESDKLIASVTKQAMSQHREWLQPKAQDIPAADLKCYPNVKDWASHQSLSTEWNMSPSSMMS